MEDKVKLNDTKFNRFVKKNELEDLHRYIRRIGEENMHGLKANPGNYLDSDLIEKLDNYASGFNTETEFIKQLDGFGLIVNGLGSYVLTLNFEISTLAMAKKLFNTVGHNKVKLLELHGYQVDRRSTQNPPLFSYQFDIECLTSGTLSGGVYNLCLLLHTLVKLGK